MNPVVDVYVPFLVAFYAFEIEATSAVKKTLFSL